MAREARARLALVEADELLGGVIELFVRREDAERFLAECVDDEPEWAGVLSIEAVELEVAPK